MPWYDTFAVFYDLSLGWLYARHHRAAAEALQLEPGHRVLVPACGTGQDLPTLLPAVQPGGAVIGVDTSRGMLDRAQARADRLGAPGVQLLHRRAEELDDVEPVDRLLWFLGLSVVPDFDAVFEKTFACLKPGGIAVIVDVHAEYRVPQSWVVEWMAEADLSRQVWTSLESRAEQYERRPLSRWASIHGGTLFLARGRRPE